MTEFWLAIKSALFRHRKRGTTYYQIGTGSLQLEPGTVLKDGDQLVVYVGTDRDLTGNLWLRTPTEFNDGRFETVDNLYTKLSPDIHLTDEGAKKYGDQLAKRYQELFPAQQGDEDAITSIAHLIFPEAFLPDASEHEPIFRAMSAQDAREESHVRARLIYEAIKAGDIVGCTTTCLEDSNESLG